MSYVLRSPLVAEAAALTKSLLADHPRRLRHCKAAGRQAASVARRVPDGLDGEAVTAAALLHDIGYVRSIARTGFHPLDGALYLAAHDWPEQVVRLVAHHSHASLVAPYHGVQAHLALIAPLDDLAADVLTYADLTAGLDGRGSTVADRLADMRVRHASRKHVPLEVRERRYGLLLASAQRVEAAVAGVALLPRREDRSLPRTASSASA